MSERNGSTEPPTEPGWYWFDGEQQLQDSRDGRWLELRHKLCYVRDIGWAVIQSFDEEPWEQEFEEEVAVCILRGRWWGPLQPPWEPQQ